MTTVECVAGDKRGTSTGYNSRKCRCDECRYAGSEYNRRYQEANAASRAEDKRRHYKANREAVRERQRQYREANREAEREQQRRYREANRDALRERQRQYNKANPDKTRAREHTRRARKCGAFVETVVARQVYERDNWVCHICGRVIPDAANHQYPRPNSPSLDHVVALANGGEHSYANCKAAHLRCNIKKGARY